MGLRGDERSQKKFRGFRGSYRVTRCLYELLTFTVVTMAVLPLTAPIAVALTIPAHRADG